MLIKFIYLCIWNALDLSCLHVCKYRQIPISGDQLNLIINQLINLSLYSKKCFGCLFKREERVSDITLGDFWGCEDIFSDTRLHSGVSLVLINSEKGARLFADKKSDKNAIVERCIDKSYLKYQGNLRQVTPPPTGYDDFWTCYKNKGFGYVANKYADSDFPRSLKYRMRHYYRLLKHRLK